MILRIRRLCSFLLLCNALSLAVFGQAGSGSCGYATGNAPGSPAGPPGAFSIELFKPEECTVPLIVYGLTDNGTTDLFIFNPCTEAGDEFGVAEPGYLQVFLGALCGQAWVNANFTNAPPSIPSVRLDSVGLPLTTGASQPVSGQASQSFILADVNGDRVPDSVFLTTAGVTVQLLAANGSVLSTTKSAVGFTPLLLNSQLAAGDWNGDGKLDLAISYYGNTSTNLGGAVFILLGNGDGTFAAPRQFNAGQNPGSLAAADFNGDGKLDLAVANDDTLNVSVLNGNGDGTFAAPTVYSLGQNETGSPRSLVAADFNGDGLPDLAVDFKDHVSVLLNTHTSFRQPVITAVPYSPIYLAYTDLNHDGHMDLALVGLNALILLFGNGDGTFQTPANYATGNQPGSLTLIPTQDNYTLAAVPDAFTGNLWFTVISPSGVTTAPRLLPVPGQATGIAAGDLTGNGQADIVVTGSLTDLSVLVAQPTQYSPPVGYSLVPAGQDSPEPQFSAIGDFNGDGKPDVLVANYTGSVSLLLGNGDGTLKPPSATAINQGARSMALGDFNGDGNLDAAVAAFGSLPASGGTDTGGVVILLGNGNGTFQAPHTLTVPTGRPISVAAGDFNGDGKLDLAAVMVGANSSVQPVTLAIFLGKGDGTFAPALDTTLTIGAYGTTVVAAGDLNHDGKLDLAVSSDETGIDILLGNGDGTFHEIAQPPAEASLFDLALVDINQDGILDLAIIGVDGAYLLGNGDGTFQAEQHFPSGISPIAFAVSNIKGSIPAFFFADDNGTVTALQVPEPPGPVISSNVSAANTTLATLAPSSIATVFGANFASAPAQPNGSPTTSLGGVTVNVTDSAGANRPAPLFYVSPTQINYEVPDGTAIGDATVTITSATGLTGSVTTPVAAVAPGVFALTSGGLIAAIVLDVSASGAQTFGNVYQVNGSGGVVPLPVDLSVSQVYLEIYGSGIRNASHVTVTIGGVSVPVISSGAQGFDPGLDQINVGPLPPSLKGSGQVNVVVTGDGQTANTTNMTFK